MNMEAKRETLIEFPLRFPIKVMGEMQDTFSQTIFDVVRGHAPDITETDIELRASSGGKYVSVTVTINAVSQEQLDNLYRELTSHPLVKYVL
ncbi:MAG: DUF493 domain-containing protein [Burkholderiales bacterium]|nr:DUF493 domain-containing protein [Burkholderiales bacterium]